MMYEGMSHTLPPPHTQGGGKGGEAALTLPTAASPILKGEWMIVIVIAVAEAMSKSHIKPDQNQKLNQ